MSKNTRSGAILPYASAEQWAALGHMGPMTSAADNAFDRGREEMPEYAGNDEVRPEAEREYQAYLRVSSSRHPLANPNMPDGRPGGAADIVLAAKEKAKNVELALKERGVDQRTIAADPGVRAALAELAAVEAVADEMSEKVRAHALIQHYERVYAQSGREAIALINSAAKAGAEQLEIAARIESGRTGRSSEEIRSDMLALFDNRSRKGPAAGMDMDAVVDATFEAESLQTRSGVDAGMNTDFTVVAPTEAEARVIRALVEFSLSVVPPASRFAEQGMITKASELPAFEEFRDVMRSVTPPEFGHSKAARTFPGKPGRDKAVALVVARGLENSTGKDETSDGRLVDRPVIQLALSEFDADVAVIPGPRVMKSLIDASDSRWRVVMPRDSEKKMHPAEAERQETRRAIDAADKVVVVWNGKEDDASFAAVAYAARVGKLHVVFDSDGNAYDPADISGRALLAHPARVAYNLGVFDIPTDSPKGRLALSMIRSLTGPGISDQALDALAATGKTINELAGLASNQETAATLVKAGIPLPAVRLLSNEIAVGVARSAVKELFAQCEAEGVAIIGPDDYPVSLVKNSRKLPTVLFVKGDVERLRSLSGSVAVVGDSELHPKMAARASELLVGLEARNVPLIQVEKAGAPDFIPNDGGILVLASGHAHPVGKTPLEWKEVEGGREALTGNGVYRISDVLVAEGERAGTLNHVLSFSDKDKDVAPKTLRTVVGIAPALEAKLSSDVGFGAFTKEELEEESRFEKAKDAMLALAARHDADFFREAFVKAGGVVVSPFAPIDSNSKWNKEKEERVGVPTLRSDATVAQAIALASRMADAVVVTQIGFDGPAKETVRAAAEITLDSGTPRPVIVVPAPVEIAVLDAVHGNNALLRTSGQRLPSVLGLPGEYGLLVEKAFGKNRAAVSTGHQIEASIDAIAEKAAREADKTAFASPKTADNKKNGREKNDERD